MPNTNFQDLRAKKKLSIAEANSIKLTSHQKEVLFGTLLGDGSLKLQKNYKELRFAMKHSIQQKEWFYWKVHQLANLASYNSVFEQNEPYSKAKPGVIYTKLRFQTRALPCLTSIHNTCYTNNQLDFTKPWLYRHITEKSLAVWWLDDGSVMKIKRRGKLATQGFTRNQNQQLKDFFFKKWKIRCSVCTTFYKSSQKVYYYLQFNTEMLKRLLKLIMPFIPVKSMVYKALLVYKNKSLQKDWIRTMKKYLPSRLHGSWRRFLKASKKKQKKAPKKRIFFTKKVKKVVLKLK